MAISVIQRATGVDIDSNAGSVSVAMSSNVTAGNALLIVVGNGNSNNNNIGVPTDTLGTTWTQIWDKTQSGYCGIRVFIGWPSSGGADTIHINDSFNYMNVWVWELNGVATTSPLDVIQYGKNTNTTLTLGSMGLNHNNEFVVAMFATDGTNGPFTWTAGGSPAFGNGQTVGSNYNGGFAEEYNTTSGGIVAPAATINTNNGDLYGYAFSLSDVPNASTFTQPTKARIQVIPAKTQATKARITKSGVTKTQTSIANVGIAKTKTQTAIANLNRSVSSTTHTVARILNPATKKTQAITSRIKNTATRATQTAIGRVTISVPKTQTIAARILNTGVTKTQNTKARIQWLRTLQQPVAARVSVTKTKTTTATARIRNTMTKTQGIHATVQHVNAKSQTATATIYDIYKLQTLSDGFTGTIRDTNKWNATTSTYTTVSQSDEVVFSLANAQAGSNFASYKSRLTYDLTNSYAIVEMAGVPNQATHAQLYFKISDSGSTNWMQFILENGTLSLQNKISGSTNTLATVAFDQNSMKWWRFREVLGTRYADYSADGVTWTTWDSRADQFNYKSVYAEFGAGTYQSETNPGIAIVENFNMPPTIPVQKTYQYKVYRGSTYLGMLPNVTTDFSYSQEINTAGSQITVTCGISADTSAQSFTQHITTEAGDRIATEDGTELITEGSSQLIGVGGSATLIMNGNRVVVTEFSQYYPNGHVVFRGQIQRWEAAFGGDGADNTINVLIYSDGYDTDHYILLGSPYTTDASQTTQNATGSVNYSNGPKAYQWNYYGQTWTTGTGITNVGAIDLMLNGTADVTVQVWPSVAAANSNTGLLGATTLSVNTGGVAQVVQFAFASAITGLTAATQYFFTVTVGNFESITIYYSTANPYAGGDAQNSSYAGGSGGGTWGALAGGGQDLYFVTHTYTGSVTTANFTSLDPTTGMLEQFMDNYKSRGGNISYNSSTIDATGLSLSYMFNTNTIYEGIEAVRNLAPDGFYYYVDIGTDLLHMKQTSANPDYVFTKGRHINNVTIVATIENIANMVYFSGGQLGTGFNLFSIYQDNTSISNYGQRIDRLSDNRVTVQGTADALGNSDIQERSAEQYQTTVTVLDTTMDISALRVGQVIGFNGFGTFVDNLQAQIVRIDYSPESATLTLGILPKRLNPLFERIRRGLIAEQTIKNPS